MRSLGFVILLFTALFTYARPASADATYVVAGVNWGNGKAQFFLSDGTYIRYDIKADRADAGYPKPIDDKTWPGMSSHATKIAAACNAPNNKLYFFLTDGTYVRYDIKADKTDAGYPKQIDDKTWPGIGTKYGRSLFGALNWGDKIQFFLDDGTYIRYDVKADRADAGYPKPIDDKTWPGLAAYKGKIAGAINWDNGKAYIFLDNNRYLRYDIAADKVDEGYPKNIDDRTWPGMKSVFRRRK